MMQGTEEAKKKRARCPDVSFLITTPIQPSRSPHILIGRYWCKKEARHSSATAPHVVVKRTEYNFPSGTIYTYLLLSMVTNFGSSPGRKPR